VRTHPDGKLLEQHCYKSAAICYNLCVYMCVYIMVNNLISETTVFMLIIALIIYTCKNAQVVTILFTSC
jgi:hypothetical protein